MNPSIVKRCLVGAVLAIAATLPGFQSLHPPVEGLKLIAASRGCRPHPFQRLLKKNQAAGGRGGGG
ncbi:hypothetical protein C4813_23985, partial [Salmonella enterica subsp. enterica serovar Rubislaw]